MRTTAILMLAVLAMQAAWAKPTFTRKPAVKKQGAGAVISFAVSEKTNVEVAVLDAKGKIVRHLAAGVLGGEKAPPPPLKPGLTQSLRWDGRTDTGKKAQNGPFSVQTRLGMQVVLDGFLAESRHWLGGLAGVATDAKGNIYVYGSLVGVHRGSSRYLAVYDRDGNYKRTIMPPPANLPAEKLKPFGVKPDPRGGIIPTIYYGTWPELYPNPVGHIIPKVPSDGIISFSDGAVLGRVRDDGTAPDSFFSRPLWAKGKGPNRRKAIGPRHMVPSPDGKYIYMTGLSYRFINGQNGEVNADPTFPEGRIHRMDLTDRTATMQRFVDLPIPEKARKIWRKGSRPSTFAAIHSGVGKSSCDAKGNLFVCDRMNGMIRVYSPEGKEIGGFKVENPEWVLANSRNGVVYVTTCVFAGRGSSKKRLLKFSSWKADAKLVAEMPLGVGGYSLSGIVLDDSEEPAIVWVAGQIGKKYGVHRVEDKGSAFSVTKNLADLNKARFGVKPRMAVHPETDLIICNDGGSAVNGYNGITGESVTLPFACGPDMAVGLDGNWYIQVGKGYSGYICRFDKELKPIPVATPPAGQGVVPENALGYVYGRLGAGYCTVGVAADANGRCYSMQMYKWANYCVAVYGADGKPEDHGRLKDDPGMKKLVRFKSAIVGPMGNAPGGIKVDWQGNIYIGMPIKPLNHKPPAGFEKNGGYNNGVGSVVKFSPEGGAITPVKGKQLPAGKKGLIGYQGKRSAGNKFMENAVDMYPELGCHSGSYGDGCMCRQPMFDVDGWGRLYIPNAITFSARIVDNAGNLIQEFGKYGNVDSRGPSGDSLIKTPEVPLGWPEAAGASYKNVYVSDVLNRRIVRMKKTFAAEASIDVPE